MKSFIQVIGNATPEGPPSVVVHFDSQRYLFNCCEGTQRMFTEKKVRTGKMKNIFLTRMHWDCTGGLPGMLLTIADNGIDNIKVFGGKNLTHFIVATRHFVYRSSMTVQTHEFGYDEPTTFQDDNLIIKPVMLLPSDYQPKSPPITTLKRGREDDPENVDPNLLSPDSQMAYRRKILDNMFHRKPEQENSDQPLPKRKRSDDVGRNISAENPAVTPPSFMPSSPKLPSQHPLAPEPDSIIESNNSTNQVQATPTNPFLSASAAPVSQSEVVTPQKKRPAYGPLPRSSPFPQAISYICQGHPIKGKFNVQAARSLGLKPGPQYGKLQSGTPVTMPDGTVIHPEQVMGKSRMGSIFIIIDIPSPVYIPALLDSQAFEPYMTDEPEMTPKCIVHLLGSGVLEDPSFRQWMCRFGNSTQHIIAAIDYCPQPVLFESHALSQLKLQEIDENIFPMVWYENEPMLQLSTIPDLPVNTSLSQSLLQFQLEPKPYLDTSAANKQAPFNHLDPQTKARLELESMVEYRTVAREVRKEVAEAFRNVRKEKPGDDLTVTTLGTGSAIPSKYRNVSATLITQPKGGSILLDAGEGTYGQILRMLGPQGTDRALRNLKFIFVSHLHADHHLGVIKIIDRWYQVHKNTKESLYIVAPFQFRTWLQEYADVQTFGMSNVRFLNSENLLFNRMGNTSPNRFYDDLLNALGLAAVKTVEVIHCRWAYGIVLEHNSGWKVVYSGDTRPCDNLVEAGQGATLLLHEATLEDDMLEEALDKRHSTTREAVDIGERMNAQATLLTHFSQRYPKIPVFTDAHARVGISFDMMQLRVGEFEKLPKFVKALKLAFEEKSTEEEELANQKL